MSLVSGIEEIFRERRKTFNECGLPRSEIYHPPYTTIALNFSNLDD